MKKTLLILIYAFTTGLVYSQNGCSPDPQFNAAGIYPDSLTGLSPAFVGQAYSENITIITPVDTFVDVFGQMLLVDIDNIDLTSVQGLPSNFSYSCDPPSCSFPGGTAKCAELYSISNPTFADVGLYPLVMETTTHVSGIPILGTTTQDDIIDYYFIEISPTTTSLINQFDVFTFEMKDIYPNPVKDQSRIQFITGKEKDVLFSVFNYLGEKMDEQIISASRGINDIHISANKYSNGMYLYSISNGEKVISKRMLVVN